MNLRRNIRRVNARRASRRSVLHEWWWRRMMLTNMPAAAPSSDHRFEDPVVIVLAAGQGRRFVQSGGSGSKLQAQLKGRAVLDHVLAAVQASGLRWHVVDAMPAGTGMGDSIAAGVRATPQASAWLVLPGDLPLVQAATLVSLAQQLQAARPRGIRCVVPHYGSQRGHPVVFDALCYPALSQLSGEQGAASVVQALRAAQQVQDVPVLDAGVVSDVDTLEDLERLARHAGAPAAME